MYTLKLFSINILFLFLGMQSSFSQKTTLKFNKGKFRIVQFTDIHWLEEEKHKAQNDSTLYLMNYVIDQKKPQLVVLTGDIVTYNKKNKNSAKAWRAVVQPMVDHNIPFVVTFGNHDTENEITTEETLKVLKEISGNLTVSADPTIDGVSNFNLPIMSHNSKKTKWRLFGFDSQAYSKDTTIAKGYDWIRNNQIMWYKKEYESSLKKENKALPAIAFLHIPLPEFSAENKSSVTGNYLEDVASPRHNSGLFAEMQQSNTMVGVFVGHDHNNDFVHATKNICVGYGRKSGFNPAYKELLERGARVIDLYENKKKLQTYILTLTKQEFEFEFKKK